MARPREFDPDTVVRGAVTAFWSQGYAGTSMPDLTEATGLSSSSLYNTFGSKEQLYLVALDAYLDASRAEMYGPMAAGTRGLEDVLEFLDRIETQVRDTQAPCGCLATNAIAEFGIARPQISERTARYRRELEEAFLAAYTRAGRLGEIEVVDVETRAITMVGLVLAINLLSGGGAPLTESLSLVSAARGAAGRPVADTIASRDDGQRPSLGGV